MLVGIIKPCNLLFRDLEDTRDALTKASVFLYYLIGFGVWIVKTGYLLLDFVEQSGYFLELFKRFNIWKEYC